MLPIIAAIQMTSGADINANLLEATRLVREAAKEGAQMVVLPESFALMAMHDSENIDAAEEQGSGTIQDAIKQCAIDNKVWIVAGTVPLNITSLKTAPLKSENLESEDPQLLDSQLKVTKKVSAASLMFNDKGEIVARYNKIHLFDVDVEGDTPYRESDTFEAGKDIIVVDTPFGKVGMSVCYDLRFPMLYQEMVKRGAEIFLVPAAFTQTTGKLHWEPLLKARAIENQCYVIAPAQVGHHTNGRRTYGNTIAIDYLGQVKALCLKEAGFITISIDLAAQHELRKNFPVLKHSKLN